MNEKEQIEERARIAERLEASGNSQQLLCEMANFLRSRHEELPSNIWVSFKNAKHGPRIKIQRNKGTRMQINDTFSMTISDSPTIVGDVGSELSSQDIDYFKGFVIGNKKLLLDYWEGNVDTSDLATNLKF